MDAFLCFCGNSTGFVEVSKKKAGVFWFPAHTVGIKPSKFSNKNPSEVVERHKNLTIWWLICLNHQQQCYVKNSHGPSRRFQNSTNKGILKCPQIIHFNRVFHYKPSNLGYPFFWKHPSLFFWFSTQVVYFPTVHSWIEVCLLFLQEMFHDPQWRTSTRSTNGVASQP